MIGPFGVEVTSGFFLLTAWLNYLDRSCLVPLTMLACGLHELGHIAAIQSLGGDVKRIRLTAIGAELVLSRPLGYWQEGLAALAGPGTNLVLAVLCCGLEDWLTFAGTNLVLALFNLLPVGRLDGGRALHCVLALLAGPDLALRLSGWLDHLCIAVLLALSLPPAAGGGNITLLFVTFWLLISSIQQKFRTYGKIRGCQRTGKRVQWLSRLSR